jgi:hypothetical protein
MSVDQLNALVSSGSANAARQLHRSLNAAGVFQVGCGIPASMRRPRRKTPSRAFSWIGGEIAERPVHFGEVHASLHRILGLPADTKLDDLAGRPQYLLDGHQPLPELS